MMRWTICPLLSILFLLAVGMALSCRAVVRWSVTSHRPLENSIVDDSPVIINSTLLRFAAIEIGEEETQQEINGLLEGNFGKKGHYRSISSWRRYNHFVERPRSSRRLPIQLRSPKYYRVWPDFLRFLRNWSSNKRFQPEIMMELINITKQPLDQHYGFKGLDRPYVSCAIVGNSGVLLKNEYGELIDGHEIVIRLNNAQVEGFQKHVGSKTNISFVNSNILHLCSQKEGCFCHPYGEKVAMVMYISQALHFLDYTICTPSHKAPLLVTDARFDVLCTRIAKYYSLKRFVEEKGKPPEEWAAAHEGSLFHYSSGMQAAVLALGICERVSIFGFGKSVLSKHHYHTNQKTELHLHDYEAEYVFYHDLVKRPQVIPFLKDSGLKIPPVTIYH